MLVLDVVKVRKKQEEEELMLDVEVREMQDEERVLLIGMVEMFARWLL